MPTKQAAARQGETSAHRSVTVTPEQVTDDETDFGSLASPFAPAAASSAASAAAAAELRSVYRVLDELVKAVTVLEGMRLLQLLLVAL